MPEDVSVRRMRAGESDRWRDLRLRALGDAPEAFWMTLEEGLALNNEEWRLRTAEFAAGSGRIMFVAEAGDGWVGCAGVIAENDRPPELIAVWVAPDHRGRGVGEAVVRAAIGWARERGIDRLILHVSPSSAGAARLYERIGFRRTGRQQPARDPSIIEDEMAIDLVS